MSIKVKNIKERLEGSYRLIRIKRIKLGFFLLQIILGLALGIVIAFLIGARLDPLFFPVDIFLFIFLLMMLFIAIEAIYFKGVEIRYTRSKSRRFLIARNSIRRSAAILGVSFLCLILLLLPFSQEFITEQGTENGGNTVNANATDILAIDSQGLFGFTRANTITFTTSTGVFDFQLTDDRGTNMWDTLVNPSNSPETLPVDYYPSIQVTYELRAENTLPVPATYSWRLDSTLSPFLVLYFPILGIIFIIVELVSIMIMYPLREKYASMSIYSKKYVAEKEEGAYIAPVRTQEEQKEDLLLESTLDIEIPSLPVEAFKAKAPPPPPVKEKVEIAQKMGEVDTDLIEAEDIACPTCGEMNSPHAAMCFVCGNAMAEKEEVPTDIASLFVKGVDLSHSGQHMEAIELFDEVLDTDKANEDALLGKGTALHQQGKWGSAIQYINTALQVNPHNIDALLQKAEILTERGKLDQAIKIYEQVLKIDPNNDTAQAGLEDMSQEIEMEDVEDVLDQFMCVPGIGLARATALYESGYTSFAQLKSASEADLAKVNGISERLAKKVKKNLESL